MFNSNESHHSSHHHHENLDDSEIFKIRSLSARKRRKMLKKFTFMVLCVLAAIVSLAVVFLYVFARGD